MCLNSNLSLLESVAHSLRRRWFGSITREGEAGTINKNKSKEKWGRTKAQGDMSAWLVQIIPRMHIFPANIDLRQQ